MKEFLNELLLRLAIFLNIYVSPKVLKSVLIVVVLLILAYSFLLGDGFSHYSYLKEVLGRVVGISFVDLNDEVIVCTEMSKNSVDIVEPAAPTSLRTKFGIVITGNVLEGYMSFHQRRDELTYQMMLDFLYQQGGQRVLDGSLELVEFTPSEYKEEVVLIYEVVAEVVKFADEKNLGRVLFCLENLQDYYLKTKK